MFQKRRNFDESDLNSVITACIAGNELAQRYLYKTYYGYVKSICLRYTPNSEEAGEVLNEGFLKVFNNLQKYDPVFPFKAWLRTIIVNTAISRFRKNKRHEEDRYQLEDVPYLATDEDTIAQVTADEILGLVQKLKPIYRNVFMLNVVDGYSLREIADMFDINEATVRSHYSRARARLQIMIKQNYPDLFPTEFHYNILAA